MKDSLTGVGAVAKNEAPSKVFGEEVRPDPVGSGTPGAPACGPSKDNIPKTSAVESKMNGKQISGEFSN